MSGQPCNILPIFWPQLHIYSPQTGSHTASACGCDPFLKDRLPLEKRGGGDDACYAMRKPHPAPSSAHQVPPLLRNYEHRLTSKNIAAPPSKVVVIREANIVSIQTLHCRAPAFQAPNINKSKLICQVSCKFTNRVRLGQVRLGMGADNGYAWQCAGFSDLVFGKLPTCFHILSSDTDRASPI